ncbi:hypothetical protein RQP46_007858 [Phenoliferia psychrophenolica]
MTGFNALIGVHRIAGEAAHFLGAHSKRHSAVASSPEHDTVRDASLRARVEGFETELALWLDSLPKHLTDDVHLLAPPFLRQRIIVFSIYYATTLLLHLPLLPKSGVTPTEPQRLSLTRCIRAAKSISAMASSVVMADLPPSAYLLDYSQHLLVAGGLLLLVLAGGTKDEIVTTGEAAFTETTPPNWLDAAQSEIGPWDGFTELGEIF